MRSSLPRRVLRLSWTERALLAEAVLCLAVASLAIIVLPFRTVAVLAGRKTRKSSPPDSIMPLVVGDVRWAVIAAARHMPWRAVCFHEALAAHWMLRRRGVASVIYYGAAQNPVEGLAAHVWVRAEGFDVVGCEVAAQYALLATFPSSPADLSRPAAG